MQRLWIILLVIISLFSFSDVQAQRKRKNEPTAADRAAAEEHFSEAMKYDLLENYDKALLFLDKVLTYMPNNAAVYFKKAEILLKKNRLAEAVPEAEKAVEYDDSNPYYYTLLAQLYERQSRFADAAKVYQQLIKKRPNDIEYHFLLAAAFINEAKYKDALKVYDKLEKEMGLTEEISRSRQQIHLRSNHLDDAIKEGRRLADAFPDEPLYQVSLAELLAANNKLEESEEMLNKTLKQFPDEPHALLLLSDIYRSQGKIDKANAAMENAFTNNELEVEDKIQMLDIYRVKGLGDEKEKEYVLHVSGLIVETHPHNFKALASYGDFLRMAGKNKEARSAYVESSKLEPNNDNLWANIVQIDFELAEFDSTTKHTAAAIELFPNNVAFWYYNGLSNLLLKDNQKAVVSLEQSRRLAVGNDKMLLDINAQLGDAYHSLKEYKKSDEAYDAVLKADENNAHVLNNYGYFLSLRKENLSKARKMGAKLVELFPDQDTYLDTYGWILYVDKDYAAARPYLEKAAKSSKSGVVIEHFGDVLYQLGEKEAALVQWKKAQTLGGDVTDKLNKKIADKKLYE